MAVEEAKEEPPEKKLRVEPKIAKTEARKILNKIKVENLGLNQFELADLGNWKKKSDKEKATFLRGRDCSAVIAAAAQEVAFIGLTPTPRQLYEAVHE
jgi:hypothetical protein